jgi:uncharacterized membrane protein YecN with MAPEG domain
MEKKKLSKSFYYLFALCLSFESFVVDFGLPIALTDISVLLLILSSILIHQRIIFNWMLVFILILGIDIFLANMLNYYQDENFHFTGFLSNYLRIVAVTMIVIFLPSLLKEFELELLIKGILFAIKLHCIIVIFDPFVVYPWTFSQGGGVIPGIESNEFLPSDRGRGLWGEPSYFGGYIGLMMCAVIQLERNIKKQITTFIDYSIIFLALLASASVTGVAVGGLIILMNIMIHRKEIFKTRSLLRTIGISFLIIPLMTITLAGSFTYISGKLSAGLAGGSTLQRLVGSSLFTIDVIREKPLLGSGLGADNQNAFKDKHGDSIIFDAIESSDEGGAQVLEQSTTTFWATLVAAGGLPCLLIFYFLILGNLLSDKRTFYVGAMIFFLGISEGGAFDVSLWFVIALALSYKYQEKRSNTSQSLT